MFHGFERVEKVEQLDLLEFHLPKSVTQDTQLLLNCTVKSQVQTATLVTVTQSGSWEGGSVVKKF